MITKSQIKNAIIKSVKVTLRFVVTGVITYQLMPLYEWYADMVESGVSIEANKDLGWLIGAFGSLTVGTLSIYYILKWIYKK